MDTWVVVAGALGAMSCALLGNFLVLRRMSMMGDAISHAVLPGLAAAFLLTGSRDSLTMFVGAGVVGVLTAVLTQWIHNLGKVEHSASMGVVFTALFALGLVMIVRAADAVDLDPGCVLYGAIELTPLDVVPVWGYEVPRAVVVLGGMLAVNTLVVAALFKELKISAFDPQLATALGYNAGALHYLLMTLVAATTVACFEAVGSILVIAMLIAPAAAAHMLTDRLLPMTIVGQVIAVGCALMGHWSAIEVPPMLGFDTDTNTAGMMAVTAGGFFALAIAFGPRHGLIARYAHRLALTVRVVREDVLGMLYRVEEWSRGERVAMAAPAIRQVLSTNPLVASVAIHRLARAGHVQRGGGGYALTDSGRALARDLIRSHRLWESYLVKFLNLPVDHVHAPAMDLEHITDAGMREALARRTDAPTLDPQGRSIPPGHTDTE